MNSKDLGAAVRRYDEGRLSSEQLLSTFQAAIDSSDILLPQNELAVVAHVIPLIDRGVLRKSAAVGEFERRMDERVRLRAASLQSRKPQVAGPRDARLTRILGAVKSSMLSGDIEQIGLALQDPTPELTHHEYPAPLLDASDTEAVASDEDVAELFAELGRQRLQRVILSLECRISAGDWTRNSLALIHGSPGTLRHAVVRREPSFARDVWPLWDTELLDIVGEIIGIGDLALNVQYLHMQSPQRMLRLAKALVH